MHEQIAVMTFVITRGQLCIMRPCATKKIEPAPISINVGSAIPSVSRVRIVYIAWGRYPSTMHIAAR